MSAREADAIADDGTEAGVDNDAVLSQSDRAFLRFVAQVAVQMWLQSSTSSQEEER